VLHMAAQNTPTSGMSRDELIRAAGEMGIPAERIHEAEAQLAAEREARSKEEQDQALRQEFQKDYRTKLLAGVGGFLSANSIFVFIWAFSGAGYFWPIWIFGWWGVALFGNLMSSIFNPEHKEKAYAKWLARRNGETVEEDEDESQCHNFEWRRRHKARRRRDW